MLNKPKANEPTSYRSSRSFSVTGDNERRIATIIRFYKRLVARDEIIAEQAGTIFMLNKRLSDGFKEMSEEREIPHKPAVAAVEMPETIGGTAPPNPMATYADTIAKCHVFYKHSFSEDGAIIVKTISLAFGRNMEQVKRHLKQGHT